MLTLKYGNGDFLLLQMPLQRTELCTVSSKFVVSYYQRPLKLYTRAPCFSKKLSVQTSGEALSSVAAVSTQADDLRTPLSVSSW